MKKTSLLIIILLVIFNVKSQDIVNTELLYVTDLSNHFLTDCVVQDMVGYGFKPDKHTIKTVKGMSSDWPMIVVAKRMTDLESNIYTEDYTTYIWTLSMQDPSYKVITKHDKVVLYKKDEVVQLFDDLKKLVDSNIGDKQSLKIVRDSYSVIGGNIFGIKSYSVVNENGGVIGFTENTINCFLNEMPLTIDLLK